MSWWAAVYARERPSHPCIWSQLKYIYFIVNPRSEGDSCIRECLVICVDCVFKRLCKFWVGHQDLSLPPVNSLPPNELLDGTSFRWHSFSNPEGLLSKMNGPWSEMAIFWVWLCSVAERKPSLKGLRDVTAAVISRPAIYLWYLQEFYGSWSYYQILH